MTSKIKNKCINIFSYFDFLFFNQEIFQPSVFNKIFYTIILIINIFYEFAHIFFFLFCLFELKNQNHFFMVLFSFYFMKQIFVTILAFIKIVKIIPQSESFIFSNFVLEANFSLILFGCCICFILYFDKDYFDFYMPFMFPLLVLSKVLQFSVLKILFGMENFEKLKINHLI